MSFREVCYSIRGLIWLFAVSILLGVLFWFPVEARGGMFLASLFSWELSPPSCLSGLFGPVPPTLIE